MKILLFSTDEYFLNVFGGYLAREKIEFDLYCYSKEKEALDELEKGKFDFILCEEGYLETYQENSTYVALGMHTIYPKETQKGTLNIYQKSDRIREELDYMLQLLAGNKLSEERKNMTMVSFFSTEGGSGKTTIAYLTAVECAKKKKVLYINLEALAVTEYLYSSENSMTMEELLLSFDEKKEDSAAMLLNAVTKNSDGVYVLPTLENIGDYLELSVTTVIQMLQMISSISGINHMIVDLPNAFSTFTETMLIESKRIVWVYSDGRTGKKKLEKIKNDPYLKAKGMLSKSSYVLNRCENQEDAKEYHAAFPVSGTLSTASQISRILEVNEAFCTGCQLLLQRTGLGV